MPALASALISMFAAAAAVLSEALPAGCGVRAASTCESTSFFSEVRAAARWLAIFATVAPSGIERGCERPRARSYIVLHEGMRKGVAFEATVNWRFWLVEVPAESVTFTVHV